ncbi:hypothetical protein Tco_0658707 [Tanacetum coccineum]
MFYADDAVFVGQWNDKNINTLTHVLECFIFASGLRINISKSRIMGVHVNRDNVHHAAGKLGCLILNSPFSYLGTKVGGLMSRSEAWNEVIEKVKSRLSKWKMNALSIGGRLTLLNSKASWVKWNYVLADKVNGGLGVSSLFALNRGLMTKWLWKFYDQKNCLWSKVIRAIHEVKELQKQGVNVLDCLSLKLGNGESTSFWHDNWSGVGVAKDIFPRLFALEDRKELKTWNKKYKVKQKEMRSSFIQIHSCNILDLNVKFESKVSRQVESAIGVYIRSSFYIRGPKKLEIRSQKEVLCRQELEVQTQLGNCNSGSARAVLDKDGIVEDASKREQIGVNGAVETANVGNPRITSLHIMMNKKSRKKLGRIVERENREKLGGLLAKMKVLQMNQPPHLPWLVPSCFVIYDLELLSLSFDFVF